MFISGMYLGWAGIGRATTGWYAFEWLDTSVVGSQEAVTAYCIGFVLLTPLSKSRARVDAAVPWALTLAQCTL
jgi:hypothetical protein